MKTKSKLDLEIIEKLYDFGALIAYEVRYCDKLTLTIKTDIRTFSKKEAEKIRLSWIKRGFESEIFTYFVNFDGAYSK